MGIMDIFRKAKQLLPFTRWRELGEYKARFSTFGTDIYRSELVKSCVRPLAEFTSKASARSSDKLLERLLNERPNRFMNGRDFLYKVRTMVEIQNTAFIYIERDNAGRPISFYPVPYQSFEAVEYNGNLFIRFFFSGGNPPLVLPWDDLAVMRKDYYRSDIAGDDNQALLGMLDLINTTNQGIGNAVKATANLRGILKSTKGMLSPDDVKAQKDQFVADYLNLENTGGIASLDATQEFTPITMSPTVVSWEQTREFRENVYRYFGVNDAIVTSNMDSAKIEAFYELRVEPFLVALSQELTSKVYNQRQRAFNNWIVYETNKLQFASLDKKIQMFQTVVLYGGMTINEWRAACNMAPVDGGDEMIRRLDAAPAADAPKQDEPEPEQEEPKEEEDPDEKGNESV